MDIPLALALTPGLGTVIFTASYGKVATFFGMPLRGARRGVSDHAVLCVYT